jgi:spermidine synthase
MGEVERSYPDYAPVRFLKGEVRDLAAETPTLIRSENFPMLDESGKRVEIEISAVKVPIGEERAAVMFVDNRTRTIYGQKYIDAEKNALEDSVSRYAEDVLANLKVAYQREATLAERAGKGFPPAGETLRKIQEIVTSMTGGA